MEAAPVSSHSILSHKGPRGPQVDTPPSYPSFIRGPREDPRLAPGPPPGSEGSIRADATMA